MDSKFFDIPLRTPSSDSDFVCKDGEIAKAVNITSDIESGNNFFSDSSFYWNQNDKIPIPEIDLALVRDTLKDWHLNPEDFPMKTIIASDPSMDYWNKMAAQELSQFQSEALNEGKFVAPFYVMAAWKMTEGYYLSPTEPALMIPNSGVPLVATDNDINSTDVNFKIAGAVCSLYMKMLAPEVLRDRVGKISSLVIFVSSPLVKYDSFSAFLPSRNVTTDSWCESLDLVNGKISRNLICIEKLALAWKANVISRNENENSKNLQFYPFGEIELKDVDLFDKWNKGYRFLGIGYKGIGYEEIETRENKSSKAVQIWGKGSEMELETRPIKLSHAGELKSIRYVRLRGFYNPDNITITVLGSRDMLKWWTVAKRKGGTVVSLPRSSFRFLKLKISGLLSENENLQGLSLCY